MRRVINQIANAENQLRSSCVRRHRAKHVGGKPSAAKKVEQVEP
jgi:hypothetical protein